MKPYRKRSINDMLRPKDASVRNILIKDPFQRQQASNIPRTAALKHKGITRTETTPFIITKNLALPG